MCAGPNGSGSDGMDGGECRLSAQSSSSSLSLRPPDGLREADPGLSETAAFYVAAELVGFEDDPERATHPAATAGRRLRDWLKRAWPDSGENLQSRRSA